MVPSPDINRYYRYVRTDLLPYLPDHRGLVILELGCATGRTGKYLKETGIAKRVIGVELNPEVAAVARRNLDQVLCVDLNRAQVEIEEDVDLILAADVVEHLVDPHTVLSKLLPRLRTGGHLLTSTPNIRYWQIISDLLFFGRWDYTDAGILDRTHLRFFTRQSITDLHRNLGMTVVKVGYPKLAGKRALLNKLTLGRMWDLLSRKHYVLSTLERRPCTIGGSEDRTIATG